MAWGVWCGVGGVGGGGRVGWGGWWGGGEREGGGGGGGLQAVLSQAGTLNVANLFTDLIRWIEPSQI